VKDRARRPLDGLDAILLGLCGAALGAFLVARAVLAPRFAEMFADLGGRLPTATRLSLSTALPVGASALCGSFAAVGLVVRRRGARRLGLVLLVLALLVPVLAGVACVVGLYLPIFRLAGAIRAE
jgi:type II secretory pathway component PulF